MYEIMLLIIAGVILFLFAVISLSEILKTTFEQRASAWIRRYTKTTLRSIIVGTIITILLDSSSAVIILTIVLVNSKILTFRQAMGIVLGANIGTTVSSQIIAMDIGKYSPIFLLIGFVTILSSKSEKIDNIGKIILYFGMIFFGLYTVENAVEPLKDEAIFLEWIKKTESPVIGALMGALITIIIQSSSATIGMAIILSKKGLLSLAGGIAIMLGAELGTCSDTLLATIKGSRSALKTGIFHVTFNLILIIIGLVLFYPFVDLVKFISNNATIERTIANAHMLFNILGVLIFVWTIPFFERVLNKWLPDKR